MTLHFRCSCGAHGSGSGEAAEAIKAVADIHYFVLAHDKVEVWERGRRNEGYLIR